MISELGTFIQLGFRHITDLEAMDHILFLLALAAIYRPRDWKRALWVVTAFTVGHSITLALAVTGEVRLPTRLIEFLIPVTIVVTCVENILVRDRERAPLRGRYRPVFAGVFGLVHGAGFANYLRDMFVDRVAVPLFGFNVGIEAGQIVVLSLAALALVAADRMIRALRAWQPEESILRARVLAVSMVVLVVASRWAIERAPW
jgi:HupE/UreJ protein